MIVMLRLFMWMMVLPAAIHAQHYKPADTKGAITFSIKNFGVNVTGSFQGLEGTVKFQSEQPEQASFDVSIAISTLQTGIELRDKHLKRRDYFDVENFPMISFVSTSVKPGKNTGEFMVTGTLTIKGKQEVIAFPFSAIPKPDGALLFTGSFTINRCNFGIGGWSVSLADAVLVKLSVITKKTEGGN